MDLEYLRFGCRGLRISCWIVGIPDYPRSVVHHAGAFGPRGFNSANLTFDKAKAPQRSRTEENACGEATEDRVSIRPDLDHSSYDFDWQGINPATEIAGV